jgi:hypothetical protein
MPKTTRTPALALTSQTAQNVLHADLANILARVKRGETLSKFQRDLLVKFAGMPDTDAPAPTAAGSPAFVKNHSQLAAALGITRQALCHWTRKPEAPTPRKDGRHDLAAWRKFLNSRTTLLLRAADMGQTATHQAEGLSEAQVYTEARVEALDDIGRKLPEVLDFASQTMRVTLTPEQLDLGTHSLFECLAACLGIEVAGEDVPQAVNDAKKRLQAMAPAV